MQATFPPPGPANPRDSSSHLHNQICTKITYFYHNPLSTLCIYRSVPRQRCFEWLTVVPCISEHLIRKREGMNGEGEFEGIIVCLSITKETFRFHSATCSWWTKRSCNSDFSRIFSMKSYALRNCKCLQTPIAPVGTWGAFSEGQRIRDKPTDGNVA